MFGLAPKAPPPAPKPVMSSGMNGYAPSMSGQMQGYGMGGPPPMQQQPWGAGGMGGPTPMQQPNPFSNALVPSATQSNPYALGPAPHGRAGGANPFNMMGQPQPVAGPAPWGAPAPPVSMAPQQQPQPASPWGAPPRLVLVFFCF